MARIAVSIQTLANEVLAKSPRQTIYFYDNDTTPNSDHDPNDFGVICACDIMQGNGLDLNSIAEDIRTSGHPELAYVIWNRRIASRNTNFEWVPYNGESDHTDHVHTSVGIGADAHKRPPYDSTRPWLGDTDMTPAQAYIQHVINYRVDGLVGNKPVITIPPFSNGGSSWGQIVQTNQMYLALKAADDEFDTAAVIQAVRDAIGDISLPGTISEEQVTQVVEAVLNRTHLVVEGEVAAG